MSRPSGSSVVKELLETARDRRTLTWLLLGPLLGPALFAVLINVVVSRNLSSLDEPLDVPIPGAEHAPNLVAFLSARGINHVQDSGIEGLDAAAAAVSDGRRDVVLVIDDRYPADFGTERAARVTVIYDRSKARAASRVERVRVRGVAPTASRSGRCGWSPTAWIRSCCGR